LRRTLLYGIDVIAAPTLCLTPPVLADVSDADAYLRINRRIVRNTVAVNYLGLCAITLPVGLDKARMPVGLQLIAPAWAEEKLLSIALAAERVLGTASERLGTPPSLL
jgi:aspartyl-tRNA(Asn)/glutamyl-tRNA(Gln) amidotransferase subunit A